MADENNIKGESMADYEDEINASFVSYKEGQRVKGLVAAVEEEEITVDLGSFLTAVIPAEEYSDDPDFRAMDEIKTGDTIQAVVLYEDNAGRLVLSLKDANKEIGWEKAVQAMEERTRQTVRIKEAVNAGVVAYLYGIRGFMPASAMALSYVEADDIPTFVGKDLEVYVIEADPENNKLILSAKEVLKEEAAKEHEKKLNGLQKGYVCEGTINRIEPYGCFVDIGDGLTGLVHISQITNKFLHSPNEVVKMGMKVKVKVLEVNDGKIKLSMKQVEGQTSIIEEEEDVITEYKDEGDTTTTMADFLKGIKFD